MPATFNERPHQNEKTEALAYVRQLMEQARKESNHEELPKLEKLLELIDSKRYGLVWEEHAELVEEEMKTKIPVFVEDETRKIQGNPESEDYNFLLEGDNPHSLHLLQKTHAGKIDVIYIDPPYNTGNKDFIYNDKIVDKSDGYYHSKWISFMYKRLLIAHQLLDNNGSIFVSLDDNEQPNMRLLLNEIFGEENFYTQIIIQSNVRGQTYKQIAKTHEYIMVYTKSQNTKFNEIPKSLENTDLNLVDDISRFNIRELRNRNPKFGKFNRPNLYYPLYVNPNSVDKNGLYSVSLEKSTEFSIEVLPKNSKGEDSCWRWGTKLASENINENTMISNLVAKPVRTGGFNIYEKYRKETVKAKTIWFDTEFITEKGTVELRKLDILNFDYPKPTALIQQILNLSSNKASVILDFFAGSGTTGHAVAQLNKEDGGNRKYILCTNNENKICEEVTYKRLANIQEELPHNLKYFKTQFIEKEDEELEYSLLNNVKTLIELEHAIGLNESGKAVAFSLSEIRALDLTGIKTVYVRQHSHALMDKNDLVRYEGIELIDVPEYYFAKEMREAGL